MKLKKEKNQMFEIYRKEIDWGGKTLILETGKVARQADGSIMASMGETTVLCTAVAARKAKPGQDFFPLTVNYQEKTFAASKIPGGFIKREGRPSEHETLTSTVQQLAACASETLFKHCAGHSRIFTS